MNYKNLNDTIVAPASANGVGAISLIRISGENAFSVIEKIFKGKSPKNVDPNTIHFGTIREKDQIVDEVLVSVFKKPHSYTKEDLIEISCHGSPYIVQRIIKLIILQGARLALPGEFTQRAFLNGRFDLAQAEAVADLIASESELSHKTAMQQMRGGFSLQLKNFREKLIYFASMIELELDFSEEDVEFASRKDLVDLVQNMLRYIEPLIDSFDAGNAVKNGIPIAIVGRPNAGKSTLLNALLNEERAIVSEIPGTTRDTIEDIIVIDGIQFRLTDTAGIRETNDLIESLGIKRSMEKALSADLVLYLYDCTEMSPNDVVEDLKKLNINTSSILVVGNKNDKHNSEVHPVIPNEFIGKWFFISAKNKEVDVLKKAMLDHVMKNLTQSGQLITNVRHLEALYKTKESLLKVLDGVSSKVTGELLAFDIRQALQDTGSITGEISNEDLLDTIFSKFCIGK